MTAAAAYSVVIPTRRESAHLRHALRSALAERAVAEVLVVHDRRPGEPPLPGLGGGDPRVELLRSEHPGPAAARNTGLSRASHRCIALLDDDDVWLPGHLDRAGAELARFGEAVVFASNARLWRDPTPDGTGSPPERTEQLPLFGRGTRVAELSLRQMLIENPIVTPGVVLAVDRAVEPVRFREDLAVMEDYELWLRLARRQPVVFDPHPGVLVRRRHGSARSNHRGMAEGSLRILDELAREGVLRRELTPREIDLRLGRLWRDLAWACLASDDAPAARTAARRARAHLPGDARTYIYLLASVMPLAVRRAWFARGRREDGMARPGAGSAA